MKFKINDVVAVISEEISVAAIIVILTTIMEILVAAIVNQINSKIIPVINGEISVPALIVIITTMYIDN